MDCECVKSLSNKKHLCFSFLDLGYIFTKSKYRKILYLLYIVAVILVSWQLYNCLQIFIAKPTAASADLIENTQIPLALTFCKVFYSEFQNFNGKDLQLGSEKSPNLYKSNTTF